MLGRTWLQETNPLAAAAAAYACACSIVDGKLVVPESSQFQMERERYKTKNVYLYTANAKVSPNP